MKSKILIVTAAALAAAVGGPTRAADSDEHRFVELERQLQALQARVSALEERTTFTSFMPDFAERFHVMHRAGDAGDWAVASHELLEMRRMVAISTSIDERKGHLMQGMLGPNLEEIGEAIEHGNGERFEHALEQTIVTCNACHAATGSDFIRVTLDPPEALSMRHPHQLTREAAPAGGHTHTHAMPANMEQMHEEMHGAATGEHAHEDDEDHHHAETKRP